MLEPRVKQPGRALTGRVLGATLVLIALAPTLAQAAKRWSTCIEQVRSLQNGTLSHIEGLDSGSNITQANISRYIWDGPIDLLKSTADRASILAVNYDGCLEICGEGIRWLEAESALAIVTTWIFPLSILFSLPFESDKRKTVTSLVNWIGSPTVTMTETLFNIWQTVQSYRYQWGRHRPDAWTNPDVVLASSYVLSCLNQFKMPGIKPRQRNKTKQTQSNAIRLGQMNGISPGQPNRAELSTEAIIQDVLYGLYEPLSARLDDIDQKKEKTEQLILLVAQALREQRRRGVVPLICTMVIFLAAFIFSIVLAFYADADSTVTPLTLGLLYSWMPAMVMLTIVDRNPHSPERASEILMRWMYNISHIRHADSSPALAQSVPQNPLPPAASQENISGPPHWWRPRVDNVGPDKFEKAFAVTDFIGQGRTGETASLTLAILKATQTAHFWSWPYDRKASEVYQHLFGAKRKSVTIRWLQMSCVSFVVYWTLILMAFTVAYNSPTVGLGCWSGSFLLYAMLSSVAWFLRFWRAIGNLVLEPLPLQEKLPWRRWAGRIIDTICFFSNIAAALFLLFITIVVLTGIADNCWCDTTWLFSQFEGFPTGGYQTFDNPETRKRDFTVVRHWVPPTITALVVLIAVVSITFYAWKRGQSLWKPLPLGRRIADPIVDLTFLQ